MNRRVRLQKLSKVAPAAQAGILAIEVYDGYGEGEVLLDAWNSEGVHVFHLSPDEVEDIEKEGGK